MQDIDPLDGSGGSYASGINNSGQVAGYGWNSDDTILHAFLYSNGSMQDLGTLAGGGTSWAYGINNNGQVVGYSGNDAFLWQSSSGMQDLGTLPAPYNYYSVANAINDSGQVVGYATNSNGAAHVFLWQSGSGMQDLGSGAATSINDNGQVVGQSGNDAFLWQSGSGMKDLGTLSAGTGWSAAYGINNDGLIVGESNGDAFIYSNGVMQDLNLLIPSNSDWTLEEATGINDSGQIVGEGVNPSGQPEAFLLTPTPEPSTLALPVGGAVGLDGYGRWQRRQKQALALAGSATFFGADDSTAQEDGPAVLPFASPCACCTKRARRAA